ncbi:hypothetical protein BH11BAC2_BH11BAC2_01470 [soil metagenome]
MQKKQNRPPAPPSKPVTIATPVAWKWVYLGVGLLALLLYINTVGHSYTVDDGTVIKSNKITTQGISAIGKIFTTPYRAGYWDRKEGLYRPISVAMFAIEWQLQPDKPWLGHLINILLYAMTAVVLLSVLKRLLWKLHPMIPLMATVLFIVHPIHTEVVANIKSRDELLSFFFGITTLVLLFRHLDRKSTAYLLGAVITFFLGLLSKESSITWMGVIPLAIWCAGNTDLKKTILTSLPFVGAILIFFVIRRAILGTISGEYELLLINNSLVAANADKATQIASAIAILGKYLWLLIAPVTLVFDYSYNSIPLVSFGSIQALLPLLIFTYALFLGIKGLKERSLLSFAILFFFGTIALVTNIFFLIEATMAERFVFTPSLGFCIAIAILFGKYLQVDSQQGKHVLDKIDFLKNGKLLIPAALVLVLFCGRTVARNGDWKNNLTLLSADVNHSPNSARIRYAYGSAILIEQALNEKDPEKKNKYLDEAIVQLEKGVSILPNYNDAWYHLGLAYKEKGDGNRAVLAFEKARFYKEFSEASRYTSSGIAYGMIQQYDKAIPDLQKAVELDPKDADAWNNLGLYLGEAGKISESFAAFQNAMNIRKNFDKAYYNRGNIRAKSGDFRGAMVDYLKAIELQPDYSDAYNNLGNCYGALQRPDSAKPWFEKAVNADPQNMKAVRNLGFTLQILGDTIAAEPYLERARAAGN